MRDLTRLASRIVMFFMQFYYRLAHHSRVSYKAYINGRTRLEGYNTIQDNVLLAGAHIGRGTYICRGSNFTDAEVGPFCSIGRNVRIVNGQHPTHTLSLLTPPSSRPTVSRDSRLCGSNGSRRAATATPSGASASRWGPTCGWATT